MTPAATDARGATAVHPRCTGGAPSGGPRPLDGATTSDEDARERREERLAIMEHDGKLSPAAALAAYTRHAAAYSRPRSA